MAKGKHTGGLRPLEEGCAAPQVAIRLGPSQRDRLRQVAQTRGLTPSQVVRQALAEFLDRQDTAETAA